MERLNSTGFQKLHTTVLYAFVFSLPLFQKLSTVLLVALVFFSVLKFKSKPVSDLKPYIVPVVLYILIGFSLFYSSDFELKYLENRASFMALPLVFFGVNINEELFGKSLKCFVLGCVTAILLCYANAIYNSISWVNDTLSFQPVVSGDFSFFESVVRDGNYFFSGFFSIFHDTIYFAMYLNIAIAAVLSLRLWKKNTWYILVMLVCVLGIYQLSSKIGIVTCLLVFSTYFFLSDKTTLRRLLIPVLLIIVGSLFFLQNPRGKVMVQKFKLDGLTIEASDRFGYALRLMSWDAAVDVIRKYPFMGVGVADAQNVLNEQYAKKGYSTPLKQNLNTHNSFLQIMLECGVLGVLLLLGMFYYLWAAARSNKPLYRHFNILFILIISTAFLFESVLNRFSGIAFFMFFYCLLLNLKQNSGNG